MRPALKAIERVAAGEPRGTPLGTLTLPFEDRCKRRLRAHLDDGREIAIAIPHGPVLRDGDLLRTADGGIVEVRSAGVADGGGADAHGVSPIGPGTISWAVPSRSPRPGRATSVAAPSLSRRGSRHQCSPAW